VRAHYARDADRVVALSAMARRDAAVLATAGASFELGRMSIAPELGLGVGRRRTWRLECSWPANGPNQPGGCDPSAPADPSCQQPPDCSAAVGKLYVGDRLDEVTYTPRASAALRLSLPLFDHVWLEGIAAVTAAPFGHAGSFPDDPPPNGASIPGEPGRAIQLGLGLRVGER
jgi:hypothetical protein